MAVSYSYKNVGDLNNCAVADFDADGKLLSETLKP